MKPEKAVNRLGEAAKKARAEGKSGTPVVIVLETGEAVRALIVGLEVERQAIDIGVGAAPGLWGVELRAVVVR